MLFMTHSPEDTLALGNALGNLLRAGDILLLTGDLGAGKSVLARGLAGGLGIHQAMPSPTFTLMQPYQGRIPFYHFDLYRLDEPDQFYEAGLDEFVGGDGAAVIEWPDCADLNPDVCLNLIFTRCEQDDDRRLELISVGWDNRMNDIALALKQWRIDQ